MLLRLPPHLLLGASLALALLAGPGVAARSSDAGVTAADEVASAQADDEAQARFRQFDADRDGQLTLAEFSTGMAQFNGVVYQRLPAQFRVLDVDGSGFLEAAEYAALPMLRKAGDAAPSLSDADANGDLRIDFKEYAALIVRLSAPR